MTIGVAIVGAGRWGPNLARNFHDSQRSSLLWVVDSQDERQALLREKYPSAAIGKDIAEPLADPAVDAVVIATPTVTHYALVKQALEAGKHVLVEKPITNDSAEGAELVALAKERSRVLMVGHVFLFNGAIRRIKQYLAEGELGRTHYIAMTRTNFGPIRMDVNASWDLATHDISITNYWLGAGPVRLSATGGSWINPPIQDAVFVSLVYPNDVRVHLHASWLHPRKAREIEIVGDRRMLTFNDLDTLEPIRIYDNQVTDDEVNPAFVDTYASFRASIRSGEVWVPRINTGEPLKSECEAFLDAVASSDQSCLSNGEFGVDIVRVLEAIDRSMAHDGREEIV
ncbi:MAG: Gfo/Idh/MocA family protein [Sandaracinaceae bacterium]